MVCLRVQITGVQGKSDVVESSCGSWSCGMLCTLSSREEWDNVGGELDDRDGRIRQTYKQGKNLNDPHPPRATSWRCVLEPRAWTLSLATCRIRRIAMPGVVELMHMSCNQNQASSDTVDR